MRLFFIILIVLSIYSVSCAQDSKNNDGTFKTVKVSQLPRRDSLISEDKVDHFLVSAYISALTYYLLKEEASASHETAVIVGASFSFSIGLGKELYDKKSGRGTASWKDVVADVVGIAVGLLILSNN